jgi:hypothetical protein
MHTHGILGFREQYATNICEVESLLYPAVRWQTSSYMQGNSDLVATCCGRVVRSAVRDLKNRIPYYIFLDSECLNIAN